MSERIEIEGFPSMLYDEKAGTVHFPDEPEFHIDAHNAIEFYQKLGDYFRKTRPKGWGELEVSPK